MAWAEMGLRFIAECCTFLGG